MTDLVALKATNAKRWLNMNLTGRLDFNVFARKAVANKARYIDIVRRCRALGSNMPDEAWVFIALTHNRESSMNFATHLGQGDPLDRKTVHVPAGRGPFTGPDAFERGAVDALVYCAPNAALSNKDWSIGGLLTYEERYNGLAYANAGRPSPYVWSGTTAYDPPTGPGGKVLQDHGPIEPVVDKQLGCAGMIQAIIAIDPSLKFGVVPSSQPDAAPVPLPSSPGSVPVLDARWLQASLNTLGATPILVVDGIAGAGTRTALKAFQTSKGILPADGVAGPATIEALKAALAPSGVKITLPPARPDLVPQVTPAKPAMSTAAKAGGAVVVVAAPIVVASQGYGWLEIGLSAFIATGLVTVVVLLIRKFREK